MSLVLKTRVMVEWERGGDVWEGGKEKNKSGRKSDLQSSLSKHQSLPRVERGVDTAKSLGLRPLYSSKHSTNLAATKP